MLHLIGRVKRDLGFRASFSEFQALAFSWAMSFVWHFVEAFSFVAVDVSYQKSVFMPCGDGGVVYVEFFGDFALLVSKPLLRNRS